MQILCIYGCGGMGREIADLAFRMNQWKKIIFADDNITNRVVDDVPVYTLEEVSKNFNKKELDFIVATGEPSSRKSIYERLQRYHYNCISFIDPAFTLSRFSSIANGTIVHSRATATCNVHIGQSCLINKHVVIGHDVTIGDFCVLSPNVTVGGNVNIEASVFIGSGAIIRNGISLGENSIIGMGAVVLKNVEPNSVMVGNPAAFIRKNVDKIVF